MSRQPEAHLSTIERIERALVVLAYFIELDGDVHVPMHEKFEAELAELRKKEDTKRFEILTPDNDVPRHAALVQLLLL